MKVDFQGGWVESVCGCSVWECGVEIRFWVESAIMSLGLSDAKCGVSNMDDSPWIIGNDFDGGCLMGFSLFGRNLYPNG